MKKLIVPAVAALALIFSATPAQAASTTHYNLDRIDQRNLPLNGQYNPVLQGAGATVYVLDSGVRITNTQFGGRASYGWDFVDNDSVAADCNGSVHYHGTNVAGIIAGATTGVAPQARIVSVRVVDCNDSVSSTNLVRGLDWVTAHVHRPAVINMSLGFVPVNAAIDAAVYRALAAGIVVVTSAGNSSADACGQSPGHVPSAINVASVGSSDFISSFSDYGQCVDLFAPGENVVSAGGQSDTGTTTFTGTSQAAPHVAGAAAIYMGPRPLSGVVDTTQWILGRATVGVVRGSLRGSPNRLLFVGPLS